MKKRIFAALMGVIMSFCLFGCTDNTQESINDSEISVSSATDKKEKASDFELLCDSYSDNGYTITDQYGKIIECVAYVEPTNGRYKYIILKPHTYTVFSSEVLKQENLLYQFSSETSVVMSGLLYYLYSFEGYYVVEYYLTSDGHLQADNYVNFLMEEDFRNKNEKYISGQTITVGIDMYTQKSYYGGYYDEISPYLVKVSEPEIIKN